MRATVLISEYLLYVPAVVFFMRRSVRLHNINNWEGLVALVAVLMQPGVILIDHAHFQYNTVMLGFVVATMTSFMAGKRLWGSIFFVSALAFKQMALYYAPAVFAYLLGTCISPRLNPTRLISVAIVTLAAFAAFFSPLLLGSLLDAQRGDYKLPTQPLPFLQTTLLDERAFYYPALAQLLQCIHRVFPFARGLFEDKVANFWCALHTFHKLHRYPIPLLQRASLTATLLAILPACATLAIYPDRRLLPLGLATTAWAFFLFSFQVHEKSVLLPLLPMTLLLVTSRGLQPRTRAWIVFANLVGCWTMFPLLKRDGLRVPYFVLTLLWAWLTGARMQLFEVEAGRRRLDLAAALHTLFYLVMGVWHVGEAFVAPPQGKPDAWVVANVLVGFGAFGLCYLWCLGTMLLAAKEIASSKRTERRVVTAEAKNK